MATTTGVAVRERRSGAETRAKILRVAMQLFTDRGFDATSTRDIATALGMNQSSLYYHFKSKDEIVASLVEQRRRDVDAFLAWIRSQPPTPDLLQQAALRWIDGTTAENLHALRLVFTNPTVRQRFAGTDLDVRAAFDAVVALFVDHDTPAAQHVYVRMVFDTLPAAVLSALGTDATDADILAAAKRATNALTEHDEGARPARAGIRGGRPDPVSGG